MPPVLEGTAGQNHSVFLPPARRAWFMLTMRFAVALTIRLWSEGFPTVRKAIVYHVQLKR